MSFKKATFKEHEERNFRFKFAEHALVFFNFCHLFCSVALKLKAWMFATVSPLPFSMLPKLNCHFVQPWYLRSIGYCTKY